MWQVCTNSLPTKETLKAKGITSDSQCPVCHRGDESIVHLIWNYTTSNDIWNLTGYQKWPENMDSIDQLLMKMLTAMTKADLELTFNIMRQIWSRRNNMVFNNIISSPLQLVCSAKDEL